MTITEQHTALTCQVDPSWIENRGRCYEPAVVAITSVCVHEHVRRHVFCAEHAGEIEGFYIREQIVCGPCCDGPEPHSCEAYEISSEDLR